MPDFMTDLKRGEAQEKRVWHWLKGQGDYTLLEVSRHEQQRGADGLVENNVTGARHLVEIKSDFMAHDTGNAVVELLAVYHKGGSAPGWAEKMGADWLLYLVVESGELLFLEMHRLRAALPRWKDSCPPFVKPFRGGEMRGLLVPLYELRPSSNVHPDAIGKTRVWIP